MGTTNLTNITILEFMSSNLVVCIKACLRHAFLKQNITLLVACVKLTRYQMYIFLEASGFTVCLFWLPILAFFAILYIFQLLKL